MRSTRSDQRASADSREARVDRTGSLRLVRVLTPARRNADTTARLERDHTDTAILFERQGRLFGEYTPE